MASEAYKIVNDIAPDNQHKKVKLQVAKKSGKSSSSEEHKVWIKVILL